MDVLTSLLVAGWKPEDHDGMLRYLAVGDDFGWSDTDIAELPTILDQFRVKAKMGEVIGVVLTFDSTMIGGEFLFCPDGDVTLSPSVNRRTVNGRSDVGWYLDRILPAVGVAGVLESWKWEETA